MRTKMVKEIVAITEDKAGMLAEVSSAVSSAGVNITAICAYGMEGKAYFMMIADNNAKAKEALKKKGYEIKERDVVSVSMDNRVGALEGLSRKLAEKGVDLSYIYGTVGEGSGPATIVFSSKDDSKALEALK